MSPSDIKTWHRGGEQDIYVGDLAAKGESGELGIGFSHYGRGASMDWITAYDEAIFIMSGKLTIRRDGEADVSAGAGEMLFVKRGTTFTYVAEEDTDMVYVTYPHWDVANEKDGLTHLFDKFQDSGSNGPAQVPSGGLQN